MSPLVILRAPKADALVERWRESVHKRADLTADDVIRSGMVLAAAASRTRTAEELERALGAECDPWSSVGLHTYPGRILRGKRMALKMLRDELARGGVANG